MQGPLLRENISSLDPFCIAASHLCIAASHLCIAASHRHGCGRRQKHSLSVFRVSSNCCLWKGVACLRMPVIVLSSNQAIYKWS